MAITQQNIANAGSAYPCGVFKIPGTLTQLQAVVLVDTSGSPVTSTGGGPIQDGVNSAILATVKDYSNSNPLATVLVDTNGDAYTAGGGIQYTEGDVDASVTGTAVMWRKAANVMTPVDASNPLPVSAASLPLPTGAATEATLSTLNGKVTACNTGAVTISTALPAGNNNIGDVDIASLPAITGTVTANAGTGWDGSGLAVESGGNLASIATSSGTVADCVTDDGATATTRGLNIGGRDSSNNFQQMSVDTSGRPNVNINGTVPISGTIAATQSGTWNITNVSGTVSLPTGAATLAEQQTQTTALQLIDDGIATTGSAITTKGMAAVGTDGTNARILKTDTSGELQVDVLTLPSNASVNVAQMNGVTVTMGNGASGTGVQRVTLASDSTGQVNLAPQPSVISTFSVQITGTTSQQVIAAPGSNVKLVLWSITIANFTATDQAQLLTGSTRFDFVKILANTSLQLTYPRGCTLGNNEAFNFDSAASADWFVSGTYSTISV